MASPTKPRRYETLRRGEGTQDSVPRDVRIALASPDDAFFLLVSGLDAAGPFDSIEGALAESERHGAVSWAESVEPKGEGEMPCPICAAGIALAPRYPTRLCWPCVLEAVDDNDRPVRFYNTHMGGYGCERVDALGNRNETGECFVRGIRCVAREAYFGGIVITRPR